MDFSLTAEQTLLQDSVSRFIQNDYDFAARQKLVHGGDGFSRAHWQTFAELGWLGVTFPESDGGFGGGALAQPAASTPPATSPPSLVMFLSCLRICLPLRAAAALAAGAGASRRSLGPTGRPRGRSGRR